MVIITRVFKYGDCSIASAFRDVLELQPWFRSWVFGSGVDFFRAPFETVKEVVKKKNNFILHSHFFLYFCIKIFFLTHKPQKSLQWFQCWNLYNFGEPLKNNNNLNKSRQILRFSYRFSRYYQISIKRKLNPNLQFCLTLGTRAGVEFFLVPAPKLFKKSVSVLKKVRAPIPDFYWFRLWLWCKLVW